MTADDALLSRMANKACHVLKWRALNALNTARPPSGPLQNGAPMSSEAAPRARRRALSVYLPPALAERLERVRAARAVGSARPPLAAIVVAAAEQGIDALDPAPSTHTDRSLNP
jgi:hypothetical protein